MRDSTRHGMGRGKEPEKQTEVQPRGKRRSTGHCVTEAKRGRSDEIRPMPKGGQ